MENVYFRFGPIIRRLADGDTGSLSYQLSETELDQLIESDPEFSKCDTEQQDFFAKDTEGCHAGKKRFHIDAYGNLQLCSDNRVKGYNLRNGSFKEGFFEALPSFPCPMKK